MILDIATVKLHLRVDDAAEDALIGVYIAAAEENAAAFLDRGVYADGTALGVAMAAAPAALTAATAAYTLAIDAANLMEDETERAATTKTAETAYRKEQAAYRQAMDGMAVNDSIKAAVMLIVGHLYANREDVVAGLTVAKLPNGAQYLLHPYRAGMGV